MTKWQLAICSIHTVSSIGTDNILEACSFDSGRSFRYLLKFDGDAFIVLQDTLGRESGAKLDRAT